MPRLEGSRRVVEKSAEAVKARYIISFVRSLDFLCLCICFFFQAEDGIRDLTVTGVQTCALPIWFVPSWVFFCARDRPVPAADPSLRQSFPLAHPNPDVLSHWSGTNRDETPPAADRKSVV